MGEGFLRERLVGAWALSSYVERDVATGVEILPFGGNRHLVSLGENAAVSANDGGYVVQV
jgi:hypothetical protein